MGQHAFRHRSIGDHAQPAKDGELLRFQARRAPMGLKVHHILFLYRALLSSDCTALAGPVWLIVAPRIILSAGGHHTFSFQRMREYDISTLSTAKLAAMLCT